MPEKNYREVVLGASFGIVGMIVGSVTTGLMNYYGQEQERRNQAILDSYKFDQGNYPVEFLQLKQLVDEMRSLTVISASGVVQLAQIQKKYPGCVNTISEECRMAHVEIIQAMRNELGSGVVRSEDIDVILRGKYEIAQKAFQRLKK
jgi:hypothetical protein